MATATVSVLGNEMYIKQNFSLIGNEVKKYRIYFQYTSMCGLVMCVKQFDISSTYSSTALVFN